MANAYFPMCYKHVITFNRKRQKTKKKQGLVELTSVANAIKKFTPSLGIPYLGV